MSLFNDKSKPEQCRVCGETENAGWHCGTITCEACKKFFLRNVKSEYLKFECKGAKMCVITKTSRVNCPFCRFKKCIDVGMKQNEKTSTETVQFQQLDCLVCGESASGYHFGVITCEGCKGFFRRNVKEGHKFLCNGNSNCEINNKTRNACRACRFSKCRRVGMDPNKSKIGRQSNLFKQKIKLFKNNKEDQTQTSFNNYQNNFPSLNCSNRMEEDNVNIEDSLDDNTKFLIKKIHNSYLIFENFQNCVTNKAINNVYAFCLGFLKNHAESCVNFINNISFLDNFTNEDQKIILINSIHPLRLIQLIRLQQQRENLDSNVISSFSYFDCDQQTHEKLIQCFPVFEKIIRYFKELAECVKGLKMDSKEFALYSAFLSFTSSCRGLKDIKQKFGTNLELGKALMKYMYLRRKENESSELLINLGPRFEKVNFALQYELYMNCKDLMQKGYHLDPYLETIVMSQFNNNNNIF